jgi:hypothetical protein
MVASVNTVAILAVILGPVVGALGLFFAWLQGQGERSHRLSLAEAQHQHERQIKRGDRLFDKRGDLYVRLLGFLDRQLMRVERTNPLMTIGPPQDPPGPEDETEAAELQAEIGVYGSDEVWKMILELSSASRSFFIESSSLDTARRGQTRETATHWENVQAARQKVRDLTDATREQIQREIENL